jgi:hypothetical protein
MQHDLSDAERLELDRLRKFVDRLDYLRSHMAAGEAAMLNDLHEMRRQNVRWALTDSRDFADARL